MKERAITQLNRLLWEEKRLPDMVGDPNIKVIEYGVLDDESGNFKGAEVRIGGDIYRGTVFFTESDTPVVYSNEAILQVTPRRGNFVFLERGQPVYQMVAHIPGHIQEYYEALGLSRDSKRNTPCGDYISSLDEVRRVQFFLRMFTDRCQRKYMKEIGDLLAESGNDWNYTMYVTLFRATGASKYKDVYVKLAKTVPYTAIAHEKGSPRMVEALLLGASGLLWKQTDDYYIINLKRDFDYLCRKYGITPMHASEWDSERAGGNFPYGFPVLRIAQLSGFLSSKEFIFNSVRECRRPQDIYNLFSAEVPAYWSEKFNTTRLGVSIRRMGVDHMNRMGINFVVPLLFAYASVSSDDDMIQNAQNLIDMIDGESNNIIKLWRQRGVKIDNACDSQAILELNNEYCNNLRCHVCPVGRRLIQKQLKNYGHIIKCN